MRILFVIDNLGAGGAERALVDLSAELTRRGHVVSVAALCEPYTLAPDFEQEGIAVHRLGLSHRWNLVQAFLGLRRLVSATQPDVVHGHLFFGGLATALVRSRRVRRVVTFHNLAYDAYPPDTAWLRLRRRIERLAMRRGIDRHIAVSRAVAGHYGRHLDVTDPAIVPNGLVLPEPADRTPGGMAAARRRLGLPPAPPLVLCVGSFKPQKGQEVLVEAVRLAVADGTELQLAFAGDGPLRSAVEAQVRTAGLAPAATFLGLLDRDEVLAALGACDVVAIPSHSEGFPLVTMEALAMGRAVVATAVGGQPEILADGVTGLLVAPGDPLALAAALQRLLSDRPLRDRLGEAGRARIEDLCDIGVVAGRHLAIYGEDTSIIMSETD